MSDSAEKSSRRVVVVGVVGLGVMGTALATRLLSRGFDVHVYNRTAEKADALARMGAVSHTTPRELASFVDIILTSLTDQSAIDSVAFGPDGFLGTMRKEECVWIDLSTIDPDASIRHALASKEAGVERLDAPVVGSRAPAEKGELTILVGGDERTFRNYEGFLSELGKMVVYLGQDGNGHKMKLIFNLHLALIGESFSEVLVFSEKLGFKPNTFLDLFNKTPHRTYFSEVKGPKIVQGDYEPAFSLNNLVKDLRLAEEQAKKAGATLPLSRVVTGEFRKAAEAGLGERDYSAIALSLERQNGILA